MTLARFALLVSILGGSIAGCGDPPPKREWRPEDHGQPEVADPDRQPSEPGPAETPEQIEARAAAALWNASCASCHGRGGRGDGPGRPPGANMADFTSAEFQSSRSDAQLAQVIRDGRGMMPAFGKQLNEQGVGALVAHIRRFAPAQQPQPAQAQPQAQPSQAQP